eukprot:TRINITY_DN2086_c0_g2_i1.p1 TRINITY_DN2086_c0_g2~~TRINITY_DN2086_c0_g2_i1.p1  ORF type:complete len:281 (-),score=59.52 TRINITY_DN2086_c0_g2_i1:12-830(-)
MSGEKNRKRIYIRPSKISEDQRLWNACVDEITLAVIRATFAKKFPDLESTINETPIFVNWGTPKKYLCEDDETASLIEDGDILTPIPQEKIKGDSSILPDVSPFINQVAKNYGRLLPDHLHFLSDGMRCTVSNYFQGLQPSPNVEYLRLNSNDLDDQSLKAIATAVPIAFPNLKLIDLSSNRFTAASSGYINLLFDLVSLQWIVIKNNTSGLSTIEAQDWFVSLENQRLGKIIFLPEGWISSSGWQTLVGNDKAKIELVQQQHITYYSSQFE